MSCLSLSSYQTTVLTEPRSTTYSGRILSIDLSENRPLTMCIYFGIKFKVLGLWAYVIVGDLTVESSDRLIFSDNVQWSGDPIDCGRS